jgi:hypothetical protein
VHVYVFMSMCTAISRILTFLAFKVSKVLVRFLSGWLQGKVFERLASR